MNERLSVPDSPKAGENSGPAFTPDQLNPDLAAAKLVQEVVSKLGTPSIISKKFAVRNGIWKALNHTSENMTGYDCSLRIMLYDQVAANSVNIDGKYFERLWAYLMKPKYTIMGTPFGESPFEEEKQSGFSRLAAWLTGNGKEKGQDASRK